MESKTKKKLATAAAGVVVVGAAVSLTAGTFSYFTDSNTTSQQRVKTGHLKIGTSLDHRINITKVIPGWSDSNSFTVTNEGNVDGYLTLKVIDKGSDTAMLNAVQLCGVNGNGCMSLGAVENAGTIRPGIKLAPGEPTTFVFQMKLPDNGQDQNYLENLQAKAVLEATLTSAPV
ncbi:hypothetical protein FOE78_20435 [Microlunatus elymi]|uniref:SipW-cognate class signal peptide n=1 Tax=Microlunatus elymi TaxID=2596828 RepID=A0A516Q3F0_9ACTN|nr:TasA family protein [Microlunatus elymi]QDP97953.1 hypothetical protein FOE78_20435 [Microlunatus elymi]